jgi:hypothetical protein
MRPALLCLVLCAAPGCAFTFDLAGGPRHERLELPAQDLENQLEKHVSESPRAMAALETVRAKKRVGTVFTWLGIGSIVPCTLASMSAKGDAGFALVVATCGASIAINVISLFVNPWPWHYADILRGYNEDFPATPWSSDRFAVRPSTP